MPALVNLVLQGVARGTFDSAAKPTNQSLFLDFLILGLTDKPNLKVFLFIALLHMYMLTLMGNAAIILIVQLDQNLKKPMYFFLENLAVLDICYTSTTMPKMLEMLLVDRKALSFLACAFQMYFFVAFVGTECVLLGMMSYDRFLAVCHPLRYSTFMSKKVCTALAVLSWFCGFTNSVVHTVFTFRLRFCCSNRISYYFCDIPPLLVLSCDDTSVNETLLLTIGVFIGWTPFLCIIVSYMYIIVTILKIKSPRGRQKSFSTCISHLAVVVLYYGSAIFSYVRPVSTYSMDKDKVISVLYSIVTPMLNPVIYTLKNQDFKKAISRQMQLRRK
ncbi:olfactory receptor 5V1-like [Bufo bufo]|uniref:olfactory receptor 5V1-like n=1 Tax=Bufo bufo TaxID=8384 RepID=UPI001ABDE48C|nr:olfactory receptor 5V1-like [Bufo bufo]